MKIESGTTGERRLRVGLFLVLCTLFTGWFAYDGYVGYPSKNVEWARTNIPESPERLVVNPRATVANLKRITQGMSRPDVEALLGPPTLLSPKTHVHQGADVRVIIQYDDHDQVVQVRTEDAVRQDGNANTMVTRNYAARVKTGMTPAEVRAELGAPSDVRERTLWYVGPAAYGQFAISADRIEKVKVEINEHKSERDIFWQKALALVLGVTALMTAIKFIQIIRTHAVLDDSGLTLNGRHVPWDAMTGLRTEEYRERGWLDLEYKNSSGGESAVRLDCYHLDKFKDIVSEICSRKEFASPFVRPETPNEGARIES